MELRVGFVNTTHPTYTRTTIMCLSIRWSMGMSRLCIHIWRLGLMYCTKYGNVSISWSYILCGCVALIECVVVSFVIDVCTYWSRSFNWNPPPWRRLPQCSSPSLVYPAHPVYIIHVTIIIIS